MLRQIYFKGHPNEPRGPWMSLVDLNAWWIICKKTMSPVEKPLVFESSWTHDGTEYRSWWLGKFDITLNGNQILPLTSPRLNNHGLETPNAPPISLDRTTAPTSTSCTFVSNCGTYGEKGKSTMESWRMTLHYEPAAILYSSLLMSLVDCWNRIGIKLSER